MSATCDHGTADIRIQSVLCQAETVLRGTLRRSSQTSMMKRGEALRTVPDVMAKNRMTADVVDSANWDLKQCTIDSVCATRRL